MGKLARIQDVAIRAIAKTLKGLPDKKLGKTRQEAIALLETNIREALAKGYTMKELAEILGEGDVHIPAPVLRSSIKRDNSTKKEQLGGEKVILRRKSTSVKAENAHPLPGYFTHDLPEGEL